MKTGRNDPCPCGSGRKYKHCCLRSGGFKQAGTHDETELGREDLKGAVAEYEAHCKSLASDVQPPTFMEFVGRPNLATIRQKELISTIAGKDFSDVSELERFVQDDLSRHNAQPVDDFEGLSAEQMHSILTQPAGDNRNLVEFSDSLSVEEVLSAELADTLQWLLMYFVDKAGEVRLTGAGNYQRSLCRAYCEKYPQWFGPNRAVPLETSLLLLQVAHEVVLALGYTERNSRREWLTTEGVDVVSRQRWAAVYRGALRYALDVYDWKMWIHKEVRHDHFDVVQDAALFLLFLLHKHPKGTVGSFVDRLTGAFPELIGPAGDHPPTVDFIRSVASELFLARFCALFGLVEITGEPINFPEARTAKYRITPLFAHAFRWKVWRASSGKHAPVGL